MFVLLCLLALRIAPSARAQEGQPDGPVYVVEEGDSLWTISLRFGVTMAELMEANSISDPGQLAAGARLVIPGLEGLTGVLTTERVPFGENLRSLSRTNRVPQSTLARLNHLTSPAELYAGASLILPVQEEQTPAERRAALEPGQSLLELAVLSGTNPWELVNTNSLSGTWSVVPGDVLHTAGLAEIDGPGALPDYIATMEVSPAPLVQGRTVVVRVAGPPGMELKGQLEGTPLRFFSDPEGGYTALQGIHALAEPGLYQLRLTGNLGESVFEFSQAVYVTAGGYAFDPPLTVSPETIDPAITQPEDAEWYALPLHFSPEKLWNGRFRVPTPPEFSDCWPSLYGNRRSYNGSPYQFFHTGLDFCGGTGTEIYAPADGIVVFAGPLTVRGNATMIDHGWGVFTGYMHQSEILVEAGERVTAGQVIGKVGSTGRVTGPHLHWEVFAGGIQVDPMEWLERSFP